MGDVRQESAATWLTGSKVAHGYGRRIHKRTGDEYEGMWETGHMSGEGLFTSSGGHQYKGGWKDSKKCGRGVYWLPGGNGKRVFDGAWADDFPITGTMLEPDGTLFLITFDGKTPFSADSLKKAERTPAGRIVSGDMPSLKHDGKHSPEWLSRVQLTDGTVVLGLFRGLRPHGPVTIIRGEISYKAEYNGEPTIAESQVPVSKVR